MCDGKKCKCKECKCKETLQCNCGKDIIEYTAVNIADMFPWNKTPIFNVTQYQWYCSDCDKEYLINKSNKDTE